MDYDSLTNHEKECLLSDALGVIVESIDASSLCEDGYDIVDMFDKFYPCLRDLRTYIASM